MWTFVVYRPARVRGLSRAWAATGWETRAAQRLMKNAGQLGPSRLLLRAAKLALRGRIHFPRTRRGQSMQDDGTFSIFRHMTLDRTGEPSDSSGAILKVRFRFLRFSAAVNRRLSLIPAPFIVAQPGFRSKLWMMDESTGEFLGLYEWDTEASARAYGTSLPMRMMKRRAAPDSLRCEIAQRTDSAEGGER